jgi:S1-C subfamily serine protease
MYPTTGGARGYVEVPGERPLPQLPAGRRAARRPPEGRRARALQPGEGPRPTGIPSDVAPRTGKGRRRVGLVALVAAVALVSGLAGGIAGVLATRDGGPLDEATPATGTQAAAAPEGTAEQLRQVLGTVLPAVVKVEARTDRGKATGSGVVFASDGYVLTNAHVVDGAQTIGITLSTSELLRARFVGRDLRNDLAVLKVRRTGLATAKVGRSADLRVGDAAIVVGSPFGFQSSVTTGIVSALHRVVRVPAGEAGGQGRELVDAIQTDAAINPGNSGGALANGSGEVVGISTAIATNGDSEANAGVGFAIPIDEALEVARALVDRSPIKVPYLGAELDTDLSPEDVARYRLGNRAGALVGLVRSGSPAAKAGLRRGDLVVRFGNQEVRAADQLTVALRQSQVGAPVPVTVLRKGRELVLRVRPTDQPGR